MKKSFYELLFFLALISFITSCADNSISISEVDEESNITIRTQTQSQQDEEYENLAKVVSVAVFENDALRTLVKDEALKQFDGDYDVLFSTIKDMKLRGIAVKDILGEINSRLKSVAGGNQGGSQGNDGPNFIDDLVSRYPELQVSCPVHADNWDDQNHIPIVTFIRESDNEGVTTTHDAFFNNISETIDAIIPPSNAVLVIGSCERMSGAAAPPDPAPDVDIVLSAATAATGISLSWIVNNPNNDEITGYRIFRKTSSSSTFLLLHDNLGAENKVYFDHDVISYDDYFYYIKAYNLSGESESSNISQAVAPGMPNAVADFSANHFIEDEIELRWTHETGQYIENTTLFERVIGLHSTYQELGTFSNDINEFFDTNVNKGKRVNYKVEVNNNQGNSNPTYDFVQVPYRDVSTPSPVILEKISYNEELKNEMESWARGKPEFRIGVVRGVPEGNAIVVQHNLRYQMNLVHQPFNRLFLNWLPSDWLEVLTFVVVEMDGNTPLDDLVKAAFDKKDESKEKILKASVDIVLKELTQGQDEEIGRRELRYTQIVNPVLAFPIGGVKLHIKN